MQWSKDPKNEASNPAFLGKIGLEIGIFWPKSQKIPLYRLGVKKDPSEGQKMAEKRNTPPKVLS